MTVDRHLVAAVALWGALNLLGGLYLASDLFGEEHGPLRTLTRAVSYCVLFFVGYLVVLPIRFSALAAFGAGATLAVEFARTGRGARPSKIVHALASAVRGLCYAIGSALGSAGGSARPSAS